MEVWGWCSVPYRMAVPGLRVVLGLNWRRVQGLGLFFVLAYLAVASSMLWAITMILLMLRKRTGKTSTKLMLEGLSHWAPYCGLSFWTRTFRLEGHPASPPAI